MAVMSQSPRTEPFGTLGYEIKRDVHREDLDAKIIITSHNSRPGLSKTTLAILLARDLDPRDWSAEEKAFMEAAEYHQAYDEQPSGSVLLFDEIEGEADGRRSMSNKNVRLSQAWAQNRYRNMITICTLPTVSMLDNRMLELSDYWINVMSRGYAHPYRVRVNDFTGKVYRERIDEDAELRYNDLPDGDPDYELLSEMKDRRRRLDMEYFTAEELEQKIESAEKEAGMECRNEWLRCLYDETDFSLRRISELSAVDVKYKRIHQIVNN